MSLSFITWSAFSAEYAIGQSYISRSNLYFKVKLIFQGQTYISSYGDENLIAQNVIHKHITQLHRELS